MVDSSRPDLLTEQEACEYLNVGPRWLKRARDQRRIEFVRLSSRTVRYRRDDLVRLVAGGTVEVHS